MTENIAQAACMLDSRSNLLRMRQESWLTDIEIAVVDRAIAAIDRLAAEFERNDRPAGAFAHHNANPSAKTKVRDGKI